MEDPANDTLGPIEKTAGAGDDAGRSEDEDATAPSARLVERVGADGREGSGQGPGRGGPDGGVVPDELPATGGAPSAPAALGAGALLLLLIGGLLLARRGIVR